MMWNLYLNSTALTIIDYEPEVPDYYDTDNDNYFVSEKIVIKIDGGTKAASFENLEVIGRLLTQALRAQSNSIYNRVYLRWDGGDGVIRRTEIVDGRIQLDDKNLSAGSYSKSVLIANLYIKRRYFWEDEDEATLSLVGYHDNNKVSGAGTSITANDISFSGPDKEIRRTGGFGYLAYKKSTKIRVFGSTYNDGLYTVSSYGSGYIRVEETLTTESAGASVTLMSDYATNYQWVTAINVLGDLPAPVFMNFSVVSSNLTQLGSLYIGVLVGSNERLLYDSRDGVGGTTVVNLDSFGGDYKSLTWSGNSETEVWKLTVDDSNWGGDYYLIMLRFNGTIQSGTYCRIKLKSGDVVVWESAKVLLDTSKSLQAIAAVRLPPYGLSSIRSTHEISLYMQRTGGGAINLDYILLLPLQYYARIDGLGVYIGSGTGDVLRIDFTNPRMTDVYYDHGLGFMDTGGYTSIGRIMVHPGKVNVINYQVLSYDGSYDVDGIYMITATYRPRYLTVRS